MFTAIGLFLKSPLGKMLMIGLVIAALVVAFMSWLHGVEADAFRAGKAEAEAAAKVERDSYFDSLKTAATLFTLNSTLGADSAAKGSQKAAADILASVKRGIYGMAKDPLIVYDTTTKECVFPQNSLGLRWSEINKIANQQPALKTN